MHHPSARAITAPLPCLMLRQQHRGGGFGEGGRQKNMGAAGHLGCYKGLWDKKYSLHRGAPMGNEEKAERRELAPPLWRLCHQLHNKDPSPRFWETPARLWEELKHPPPSLKYPHASIGIFGEVGEKSPARGGHGNPPSSQHHSLCAVGVFQNSLMPRNARDSFSQWTLRPKTTM